MCFYVKKVYACGDWRWDRYSHQCQRPNILLQTCELKVVDPEENEVIDDKVCPTCEMHEVRCRRVVLDKERLNNWAAYQGRKVDTTRQALQDNIKSLEAIIEKTENDMAELRYMRERRLRRDSIRMTWFIGWYGLWDYVSRASRFCVSVNMIMVYMCIWCIGIGIGVFHG